MQGMSERQYAAHVGLSRGAIQKAKAAERLVLFPEGRLGTQEEVARLAAFLLSPAASWINGENIVIDGGQIKRVHF